MRSTFLIWSLEHTAWWRPGRMGYTRALVEAGRYDRAEALDICEEANLVLVHECAIPLACTDPAGGIRRVLQDVRDDASSASLVEGDRKLLAWIEGLTDRSEIVGALRAYYGDLDRANRTPRAFLYLHLGLLIGVGGAATDEVGGGGVKL